MAQQASCCSVVKHARAGSSLIPSWWLPPLLGLLLLLLFPVSCGSEEEVHANETEAAAEGDDGDASEDEDIEPARAVLFPAFSLTIGVMVFYLLSRYAHVLPYTGVMFLIGTLIGIGVELHSGTDNQLNESVRQWVNIDAEVLLLIFLPGLIFRDALGQNAHLFAIALVQCIIFAFPLVLAGAALTALIGYYIFPYGWSFNLCMTFGSILSATDPVAVAALLEQVGAPPRLKVHIAGEALLNDGAAIVFFSVFADLYLTELDGLDVGVDHDFKSGVAVFCRKAFGAVASGIFFGLGLLIIIYSFHKRFDREENVVEVSATVAVAYVGYYVSEVVWGLSGVISTVVTGVMVRFLGRSMINDPKLLDDFWVLLEHILNTVLFVLGGVVWGTVIAKGEKNRTFKASDWGYLILLYVLLLLIRAGLFAAAFPLVSRIGLKTCWQETVFQVYGGLRGAVGIALAIALDNEVRQFVANDVYEEVYVEQTQKLFAFVGGIAFMTLSINGVTAGPLLRKLGLADSTESREKIVDAYQSRFKAHLIEEMVKLLSDARFQKVNFALVKHHVPYLADMTRSQLMEAVEKHRDTTRAEDYQPPHLRRVLPYLPPQDDTADVVSTLASVTISEREKEEFDPELHARKIRRLLRTKNRMKRRSLSTMRVMMEGGDSLSLREFRSLFISILRSAYEAQIHSGELEDRQSLAIALDASLDFADDAVGNGEPLKDWEFLQVIDGPFSALRAIFKTKLNLFKCCGSLWGKRVRTVTSRSAQLLRIERSLAFMAAHRWAQTFMQKEFADADCELTELGKQVFHESQAEYEKAKAVLDEFNPTVVSLVVSHKFCIILLNTGVSYISSLVANGLLKDQEAEHVVGEIEDNINEVLLCDALEHPGEISLVEEEHSLQDVDNALSLRSVKEDMDGALSLRSVKEEDGGMFSN